MNNCFLSFPRSSVGMQTPPTAFGAYAFPGGTVGTRNLKSCPKPAAEPTKESPGEIELSPEQEEMLRSQGYL